jgi:hypothetical protein
MAGNGVISRLPVTQSGQKTGVRRRDSFFFGMSIALLLAVVIGFAPTLYLSAFRDSPPLPGHLHVHGAILTGWFVWLAVQTSLIRANRIALHRRLGAVGAVLGLAVVFAGPLATFNVMPRIRAAGFDLDMDIGTLGIGGLGSGVSIARFMSGVVWANLASIVTFAVLLLSAILLRRRSESHKRLMLLASISIVAPALARISRWPALGGEQGPFIPLALLLLLLAVVLHDVVSRRRVHPATWRGATFAVLMDLAGGAIGASPFGEAFVREM